MTAEEAVINGILMSMLVRKKARAVMLVVAHQEGKAEVLGAFEDGCTLNPENILLDVAAEMESKPMKTEQVSVDIVPIKVAPAAASSSARN